MGENKTHSLKTEIELAFGTSGIMETGSDIDQIDEVIALMEENMAKLEKSMFEVGSGGPFKRILKELDDLKVGATEIDGETLQNHLASRIADAITESEIKFIGGEGAPEKMTIKLTDEFWERNQKTIIDSLGESFSELSVVPGKFKPLDTESILEAFQEQFNKQIVELINSEQIFRMFDEKIGEDSFTGTGMAQFRLSEEAVAGIMRAIENRVVTHLSNEDNIGVDKIELDMGPINDAITKIQESIGNIDSVMKLDDEIIANIPEVGSKINEVQQKMVDMITSLEKLSENMAEVLDAEMNEEAVARTAKRMDEVQEALLTETGKALGDIINVIESKFSQTTDLSGLKTALDEVNATLDKFLNEKIVRLNNDIKTVMENKISGDSLKESVVELDIVEDITKTIISELAQIGDLPFELNKQAVADTFEKLSEDISLKTSTQVNLMGQHLEEGMKLVVQSMSGKIMEGIIAIAEELTEMTEATIEKGTLDGLDGVISKIDSFVLEYLQQMLDNLDLDGNIASMEAAGVTVPDHVMEKIQKAAQKSVIRTMEEVASVVEKDRTLAANIDYKEIDAALEKHTTMMTNSVLRGVRSTLTEIRTEYNTTERVKAQATMNIMEKLEGQVNGLVGDIVRDIETILEEIITTEGGDSLGAYTDLNYILSGLHKSLEEHVIEYIQILLNNTDFVVEGGFKEVTVEVPPSFQEELSKTAGIILDKLGKSIGDKVEDVELVGDGELPEDFYSKLNKHRTMIVNAVLRDVQSELQRIRLEFLDRDVETAPATKNLMDNLDMRVRQIVEATSFTAEYAINLLGEIKGVVDETTEIISKYTNKIVEEIGDNIDTGAGEDVELDLTESVRKLLPTIIEEVERSVGEWNPVVSLDATKLYGASGLDKLSQTVENLVSNSISATVDEIARQSGELQTYVVNYEKLEKVIDVGSDKITDAIVERIVSTQEGLLADVVESSSKVTAEIVDRVVGSVDGGLAEGLKDDIDELNVEPVMDALYKVIDQIDRIIEEYVTKTEDELRFIVASETEFAEIKNYHEQLEELGIAIEYLVGDMIRASADAVYMNTESGTDRWVVFEPQDFAPLKVAVKYVMEDTIMQNARAMMHMLNVDKAVLDKDKIVEILNQSAKRTTDKYMETIRGIVRPDLDEFKVSTTKLHSKVKKELADMFGVTVGEFTKAIPTLEQDDARKAIFDKNLENIRNNFGDRAASDIKDVTTDFNKLLREIEIPVGDTYMGEIKDKMQEVQDSFMNAVMRVLKEQVRFLTGELKEMRLDARSLGDRTLLNKTFTDQAMRAAEEYTGEKYSKTDFDIDDSRREDGEITIKAKNVSMDGTDVVADDTKIEAGSQAVDAKDVKTTASNILLHGDVVTIDGMETPVTLDESGKFDFRNYPKQRPFSDNPEISRNISNQLRGLSLEHFDPRNVVGTRHNPLHLSEVRFKMDTDPFISMFEGITSNMLKYFVVGYMMRLPIEAITQAVGVSSKLDYHTTKSKQNMLIKDPEMEGVAERLMYADYQRKGRDIETEQFRDDVRKEAAALRNLLQDGLPDELMRISKMYRQDIDDVGRFYSIGARKSDNPYEVLAKTEEVAKVAAAEEDINTDFAATSIEALINQWGIGIHELDYHVNMLLKTAMLSNTTVTDLLTSQRDTGAMFKNRLAGLENDEAFATAMALSSMFTEATGSSGSKAGTFWRNILVRPYSGDTKEFLTELSQYEQYSDVSPYVERDGQRVQRDYVELLSNIIDTMIRLDDESEMEMLSELYPLRTIGGAEAIAELARNMKQERELAIQLLKDEGKMDKDADESEVTTQEVISSYVENIMSVTEDEITEYIAGMQTSMEFRVDDLRTQWQSTIYAIFEELQSSGGGLITYAKNVLKMFEDNAHWMADILDFILKVGIGSITLDRIKATLDGHFDDTYGMAPIQFELQDTYKKMQQGELKADNDILATSNAMQHMSANVGKLKENMDMADAEVERLTNRLAELKKIPEPTAEERTELVRTPDKLERAKIEADTMRELYDTRHKRLGAYGQDIDRLIEERDKSIQVGKFIERSAGARNIDELTASFANIVKEELIYSDIAESVLESQMANTSKEYEKAMETRQGLLGAIRDYEQEVIDLFAKNGEMIGRAFTNEEYKVSDWENMGREERNATFGNLFDQLSKDVQDSINNMVFDEVTGLEMSLEDMEPYDGIVERFKELEEAFNEIDRTVIDMDREYYAITQLIHEAKRPHVIGMGDDGTPMYQSKTQEEVADSFKRVIPYFDIEVDDFDAAMEALSLLLIQGKQDVDEYEDSLREIATQLGVSEEGFETFAESVREVNKEVIAGQGAVMEYINTLRQSGKFPSRLEPKDGESAQEYQQRVIQEMGKGPGVVERITGTKDPDDGKKSRQISGFMSKVVGGIGSLIKTSAKSAANMALIYAVTDTISKVMRTVSRDEMSESDKLSLDADETEGIIRKMAKWGLDGSEGAVKGTLKTAGSLLALTMEASKAGIAGLFGEVSMKPSEILDVWKEVMVEGEGEDRKDLISRLNHLFEVYTTRIEANTAAIKEAKEQDPFKDKKNEFLTPGTIEHAERMGGGEDSIEEMLDWVSRQQEEANRALNRMSSETRIKQINMLIRGVREDSEEMRALIDRDISERSKLVREALRELESQLMVVGGPLSDSPIAKELQDEILKRRAELAEMNYQQYQNQVAGLTAFLEQASRERDDISLEKEIAELDYQLSKGAVMSDRELKEIRDQYGSKEISMIESHQAKLQAEAMKLEGKDREQAMRAIKQMEAEKKRIMLDMVDKMDPHNMSTFNLPSGLEPMTFFESAMSKNTHTNATISAGDTTVNVTVENMEGGNKAQLDQLGSAVASAVSRAQRDRARQLSRDVKSGLGRRYQGWSML